MIEFQLDTASGVATYLQLVQQVHQALQLGLDQHQPRLQPVLVPDPQFLRRPECDGLERPAGK